MKLKISKIEKSKHLQRIALMLDDFNTCLHLYTKLNEIEPDKEEYKQQISKYDFYINTLKSIQIEFNAEDEQ